MVQRQGSKCLGEILIPASLGLKKNPSQHDNAPTLTDTHTHILNTRDQHFLHVLLDKAVLFERKTKQSKNL